MRSTLQRVFGKRDPNEPQPKEMDLGKSGGFHYDKQKGKWVIEGEEDKEEEISLPPPIVVKRTEPKPRGRYFDPLASQEEARPFRPAGVSEDNGVQEEPPNAPSPEQIPTRIEPAGQVIASYEFQAVQEELLRKVEDLQAALVTQRAEQAEEAESQRVEREGLETRVDMLTSDKAKAYMQVRELEFELRNEKEERAALEAQVSQLKTALSDREKEIVTLRVAARSTDLEPPSPIESAEELHVRLIQSDTEKANLQRILSEKDALITDLRDQLDQQNDKVTSLAREVERVKYDCQLTLAFKDEEAGRVGEQLERARMQLGQTRELHRQAQEQLERMLSQREEYEIRVSILSQAKSKADIEVKKALFDRIQAESEVEGCWRMIRELQEQVRRLEEHQVRVEESHGDTDVEALIDAHMQMQAVEAEKLSLREELLALRYSAQEAEDRIRLAAGEEARSLRVRVESLQRAAEERKAELSDCRVHLQQTLKSLADSDAVTTHERESLKNQLFALEKEANLLKDQRLKLENQLQAAASEGDHLQAECKQAHQQTREQTIRAEAAEMTAKQLQESIAKDKETGKRLEEDLRRELQGLVEAKQVLQREKQELGEQLQASLTALEDAKSVLESAGTERLSEAINVAQMTQEELAVMTARLMNAQQGTQSHYDRLQGYEHDYHCLAEQLLSVTTEKDKAEISLIGAKSELQLWTARCEDQASTIAALQAQLAAQNSELEELSQQKVQASEEVLALQAALSDSEEVLHEMRCEELQRVQVPGPDLQAIAEELETMRNSQAERDAKEAIWNAQIQQLQTQLHTLKSEKAALQDSYSDLKRTETDLFAQLEKSRSESRTHIRRFEELQARYHQQELGHSQIEQELETMREQALSSEDIAAGLRFQVHQIDAELAQAKEKCTSLTSDMDEMHFKLREQKVAFEKKVKELEGEIGRLQRGIELERGEKEHCKQAIGDMEQALEASARSREEDGGVIQELEEAKQALAADLVQTQAEADSLLAQVQSLQSQLSAVSLHSKQQADTVSRLESEVSNARIELPELKKTLLELRGELETAKTERETLGSEIEKGKRDLETVNMELEAERTELEATKRDLESLQDTYSTLQASFSDLEAAKDQEIAQLQASIEQLRTLNSNLTLSMSSSSQAQLALQASETRFAELEKSLAEQKKEMEGLRGGREEWERRCKQISSELASTEGERGRLEKTVAGLKASFEQMKKQYEEMILKDRATATEVFEAQSAQIVAKDNAIAELQSRLAAPLTTSDPQSNPALEKKLQELNESLEELYEKNFALQQEAAIAQRLSQEKQQLLEELKKLKEGDTHTMRESLKRREEELQVLKEELMASMERLSQASQFPVPPIPEEEPVVEETVESRPEVQAVEAAKPVERKVVVEPQAAQGWISGFLSAVFLTEKEQD